MGDKIGVVLAQMGGPATLDDVTAFIRSVFRDPSVVPLPGGPTVRRGLSSLIAAARGPAVRKRYAAIGGGSPIGETTAKQAGSLERELRERGIEADVEVAFRYTAPDTEAALAALRAGGAERLVFLPLYPQYSEATTGSSVAELRRVMTQIGDDRQLTTIPSWGDHPTYLDALARQTTETLAQVPANLTDRTAVVFSAHGLPRRSIDKGDPYADEIETTVAGVVSRLGDGVQTRLGYQSRVGPLRWIGPDTTDVVTDLGASGCKALVAVAVSFVSDHLETLHELDVELRETARSAGIETYRRVPAFNDGPDLAAILADVLEGAQ